MKMEFDGKLEEMLTAESETRGLSVKELVLEVLNDYFETYEAKIVNLVITEVKCFSAFMKAGTVFTLEDASTYYKSLKDLALKAKIGRKVSAMCKQGKLKNIKRVEGKKSTGDRACVYVIR